jgi:hypothetical protein
MATDKNLQEKSWFRFVKLSYVLVYVALIAAVVVLAYIQLPYEYISDWESTILCSDGKAYKTGANSIYPSDGVLNTNGDIAARKLCAYNIVRDYSDQYQTPVDINYSLLPVRKTHGGYTQTAQTLFWGLAIVCLAGEIIRRSFFYVVTGRPFFAGISIASEVTEKRSKKMFCAKCGQQLGQNPGRFCSQCGAPVAVFSSRQNSSPS